LTLGSDPIPGNDGLSSEFNKERFKKWNTSLFLSRSWYVVNLQCSVEAATLSLGRLKTHTEIGRGYDIFRIHPAVGLFTSFGCMGLEKIKESGGN